MMKTLNDYAKAINEEKESSDSFKKEAIQDYKDMVKEGVRRHEELKDAWGGRVKLLINQIYVLGNSTVSTDELREEMTQRLEKERKQYQREQRRAVRYFQKQLDNMQKLITRHMKATDATILNMNQAIEDIRHQLRELSNQLTMYLKSQSRLIK